MGRKTQENTMMLVGVTLAVLVVLVGYMVLNPGVGPGAITGSQGYGFQTGPVTTNGAHMCPDDGDTDVTVNVVNALNKTGSEGFDVTARFYSLDSGHIAKITDTTSPNASSLNCGEDYVFKIESTDGASGDNSRVISILQGEGAVEGGNLVFTADGSNMAFEVAVDQQATLEGRMYDNINAGFMYDTGDADTTSYETDGVSFTSTTSNTTNYTVGSSGEVDVTLIVRAVETDTNWNDRGTIILVDADATKWDVDNAVLKVNGVAYDDYTDQLTSYEKRAWNGYELAFFVPESVDITQTQDAEIRLNMFAVSGVDPGVTNDIEIDIGGRGQYQVTTSANELAIGGVKDDSSATVVRSLYDSKIEIG